MICPTFFLLKEDTAKSKTHKEDTAKSKTHKEDTEKSKTHKIFSVFLPIFEN